MTTNNKGLSQICNEYLTSLTPSFKYQLNAGLKILESHNLDEPLKWLFSHNVEDIKKFLKKARDKKGLPLKNNTQKQYASALCRLQSHLKAHHQPESLISDVKPKEDAKSIDSTQEFEQPQPETPKPTSTPELEPPQDAFNLNEWYKLRDSACPECRANPFKGKDDLWYVVCSIPIFKEGKYGKIPSGKVRDKIHIEVCQKTQNYYMKRSLKKPKKEDFEEVNNEPDKDARINELESEIRRLRERMKELEPFESALFTFKQKDRERKYITRFLTLPSQRFKCWKGTSNLEDCSKFCGSYNNCKDRLNHEPLYIALTHIEKQLRNRKYCPLKEQIVSEHDCLFECQDREECQKLRQDPPFLKERIEKVIDLYLDTMYPISPLGKWAEQQQRIEQPLEPTEPLEPPEPSESLKELPDNITYIDPKTATMTLEEIEKELGLNGTPENEELDVFDMAERDTPPLRFASGKTLEKEVNITETSKPTTIDIPMQGDNPHNAQTLQESKTLEDPSPHIIIWQIQCPRDKTQKIQKECLSSCKVWKRTLCTEYQKFPQTEEDLSFKAKG